MSHHGTNWAIIQRGLKPTTKIVLWHLCDRHNPDYGCFPTQARLAHDCEISRSTLNLHLIHLEKASLLRRVARINPVTKRQMSTRYFLGFEDGFPAKFGGKTPDPEAQRTEKPCPESGHGSVALKALENSDLDNQLLQKPCLVSGHGAVSDLEPEPCPKNSDFRVRNSDTNPVREPLREPVKEEEERAGARDDFFEEFFGELLKALGFDPEGALPAWWQGRSSRKHVRLWREDLGLTEKQILKVATETRHDHPAPPDGPKALDRFMERAARRDAQSASSGARFRKGRKPQKQDSKPRPCIEELAAFYAKMVNSDRYLHAGTISNNMRNAMLSRGLVTLDRLQMRGVL